mmetsp:Transcript_32465/g.75012  ORF Transcript_32465/g.75012 Transcript_32465/m.75012 type:complete len:353 (+) Transcript_32465:50-1108(+)
MEHSGAELGHEPTTAPKSLFHADLKSRDLRTQDSHWKNEKDTTSPLSPTSDVDTTPGGLSVYSFERTPSDETLPAVDERVKIELSKTQALALQKEFLAAFSDPGFQKRFSELLRERKTELWNELVRQQQMKLIGKFGFETSDEGVENVLQAMKAFAEDPDMIVLEMSISEILAVDKSQQRVRHVDDVPVSVTPYLKPNSADEVCDLLRLLLVYFSRACFQQRIQDLKQEADKKRGAPDPKGYYHLPGRAELALQVHKIVLPDYGFEGNAFGVQEMIKYCANFLHNATVAELLDAINAKLGMASAACQRFRQNATSLVPSSNAAHSQRPLATRCHSNVSAAVPRAGYVPTIQS